MNTLALMMAAGAVAFGLAKRFRLPVIPLLLIIGTSLSLAGIHPAEETLTTTLQLGLAFLVFVAGTELNPNRFKSRRKSVLWVAAGQFAGAGFGGYLVARWFGWGPQEALYLACATAASSTVVALRQLKKSGQLLEPFGRLVLGVLLVQDLAMIVLILVLSRSDEGYRAVGQSLLALVLLAGLAWFCQQKIMPRLLARKTMDEEVLLLTVLAVLFAFLSLARTLGMGDLTILTGAFLAGFALSDFPVSGITRSALTAVADFFMAVFFISLGVMVQIPNWSTLWQALAFAGIVLVVTPPLVTLLAEWQGLTSRAATESGLLLAQTSELSLVLGLSGLLQQHISSETFSVIALVTVITMTWTPFLATDRVTRWLLHFHPVRRRLKTDKSPVGHVLVLGFGSGGMWVIKPLLAAGHKVLVVDDDPMVMHTLERQRILCLRGDGSDEKILDQAGANRARVVIVSMRRVAEAQKVLKHVKNAPVIVRVFEEVDAQMIERFGGIPILNSHAAADTFMEWFDKSPAMRQVEKQTEPVSGIQEAV